MATGYGGTYRGTVVNDQDPTGENRLQVLVPEVLDQDVVWALPSLAPGVAVVPTVGADVWVSFEHGDSDYPVWEADVPAGDEGHASGGYAGKYRGVVLDDGDPLGQSRLLVSVPEVLGGDSAWAVPALPDGADATAVPTPGTEVWIEFEQGDLGHPLWVGLA